MKSCANIIIVLLIALFSHYNTAAQTSRADYDSTLFIRDTVRPLAQRFVNLAISGYIQSQYQVAQSKGAPSYAGGNFSDHSDDRFMLRRARIKVEYVVPAKNKAFPKALFSLQFDATERGVAARDIFLKL